MNHKKIIFLISIITICTAFAGCKKKTAEDKPADSSQTATVQDAVSDDSTDDYAEEKTPESDETENNVSVYGYGKNFLKVDTRVYYIKLGTDTIERTMLWGKFRNQLKSDGVNYLMCYDELTGEKAKVVAEVPPGTVLTYKDNKIYSSYFNKDENEYNVFSIDLGTGQVLVVSKGYIAGVDEKTGRYIATGPQGNGDEFHIFDGDKELKAFLSDSDEYFTDIAITNGVVLYRNVKQNDAEDDLESKIHVYSLDTDTDVIIGDFTENTEEFMVETKIDRMSVKDGYVYYAIGSYAGTGYFLQEGSVYKADISKENSTEKVEDIDGMNETTNFLEHALPDITFSYFDAYDVSANTDNGMLEVYIPDGKGVKCKRLATLKVPDLHMENDEILYEVLEYVDGEAFMIINEGQYNAEESIGWRDAYTADAIHYCKVNNESGKIESIDEVTKFPDLKLSKQYYIENPGDNYYITDMISHFASDKYTLSVASSVSNDITDIDNWFQNNDLWDLKSSYTGQYNYSLSDDYNLGMHSGYVLNLINRDTEEIEYKIDLSDFYNPVRLTNETDTYWKANYRFAYTEDDILYVSMAHPTYSDSMPYTAYILAIDLTTGQLLWKTNNLVSNADNFALCGDVIFSGYGFTAEDDYIYQICKKTGLILDSTRVKTGPDYLYIKNNQLYVRTYNTDYIFNYTR